MNLLETPNFNIYTDLSPREYAGSVQVENMNNRRDLTVLFAQFVQQNQLDSNNICIIVTGSDGKSERHAKSNTEVSFLVSTPEYLSLDTQFAKWFESHSPDSKPVDKVFDINPNTNLPEVRLVEDSNPDASSDSNILSYAYGDRDSIYPERMLNAISVYGNEAILRDAKLKTIGEIVAPRHGKRIRKELKSQLREYRKVLESRNQGIFHRNLAYTLDPPRQYYNEDPIAYTVGFKIPALRSVQRALDVLTVQAVMDGSLRTEDVVDTPTDTTSRIEALRKKGIIPLFSSKIPNLDIIDSYEWFLQQYHIAQRAYHRQHEPSILDFPKDDFLMHRMVLLDFLNGIKK